MPLQNIPDSKVQGANMGLTWVLSAPGGPHIGPINLAIGDSIELGMQLVQGGSMEMSAIQYHQRRSTGRNILGRCVISDTQVYK